MGDILIAVTDSNSAEAAVNHEVLLVAALVAPRAGAHASAGKYLSGIGVARRYCGMGKDKAAAANSDRPAGCDAESPAPIAARSARAPRTSRHPSTLSRFADLYDQAPAAYLTLDTTGRIEQINRTGAEMLGWPAAWLAGRWLGKWIVADDLGHFEAHLADVAARPATAGRQLRLKNRHGRLRQVLLRSTAQHSANGRCVRCLSVMIDVSEDRRDEQRARVEQAKLMQAARINMMGEMATSLAHELNQPLGAILLSGTACRQMIAGGGAGTDFARLDATLERLCESAAYAGEIIRHLRRFLRSVDGERKPVDLNALVVEAMRMIEAEARDHEVSLRLELEPALPSAFGDAVQIEQVLLNLVRNSIDALAGSASLIRHVAIRTAKVADAQIRLTVSDAGPGVAPKVAARLFEPFVTSKARGMGLGLCISRSIVEAHAGRLWLDSGVASGATFHCSLPTAVEMPS